MLCDTHAHLHDSQFALEQEQVIEQSFKEGQLEFILNVSCSRTELSACLAVADKNKRIFAVLGFHPYYASEVTDEALSELERLAQRTKVVAIGEIGLDYYRGQVERSVQEEAFRVQIRLAKRLGLPLVIHARDADQDVLKVLKSEQASDVGGVWHCFNGNIALMEQVLDLGFSIGLGGIVTFPKATEVRVVAAKVPLDSLLLETDAPYLAPCPYRGKRNQPGYVTFVANEIAKLRGIDVTMVQKQTTNNAFRLFSKVKLNAR
jgi:TatD DNase family protein